MLVNRIKKNTHVNGKTKATFVNGTMKKHNSENPSAKNIIYTTVYNT